jgi:hypothetical protein
MTHKTALTHHFKAENATDFTIFDFISLNYEGSINNSSDLIKEGLPHIKLFHYINEFIILYRFP